MTQNNTSVKEEVLKSYIDQVFNSYDTQRTGNLSSNDITAFFNDLFRSVDVNIILNSQQSEQAIRTVYPNYSNYITKDQLYQVFKSLLGISNAPQSQPNSMPQYSNYNPTMINTAPYINPQAFYQNANLQSYMSQLAQGQNYYLAQNYMRQGQGLPNGYPLNQSMYGQPNSNTGNGQYRK